MMTFPTVIVLDLSFPLDQEAVTLYIWMVQLGAYIFIIVISSS
jgi:hypothetical protein